MGLDKEKFRYWNMDNESEIWSGTHDDIMPTQISGRTTHAALFEVPKRPCHMAQYKACRPGNCHEWQWYATVIANISYNGKNYCWLE
jgi:hypothetical protein